MGFLDNSGDIILDAVLTDLGRKRLAEGKFSITQFALGDEEINYALYNPVHPSGSAYYDLEIIQTPILESFTNNTSTMRSRLITFDNNSNFLYLPVLKENTLVAGTAKHASSVYLVAVDEKTQVTGDFESKETGVGKVNKATRDGVLFGFNPTLSDSIISIHQGIDNLNKPKSQNISNQLKEDEYVIQIDGRFGTIVTTQGQELTNVQEDDDGFLFYTVNQKSGFVENLTQTSTSPILGSRGTAIAFKIKATDNLTDNSSFFDRFGFSIASGDSDYGSKACKAIDSMVRVTGLRTGYSIDIPVRFIKDVDAT